MISERQRGPDWPSDPGVAYRLSQAAENDLVSLYLEGATRFGLAQEERYALKTPSPVMLDGEEGPAQRAH